MSCVSPILCSFSFGSICLLLLLLFNRGNLGIKFKTTSGIRQNIDVVWLTRLLCEVSKQEEEWEKAESECTW